MDDSLSRRLRLREPTDAFARSVALTRLVVDALNVQGPVQVLDLATGTGSNIRYLMERLPQNQRWLGVDKDAALLTELPERMTSWGGERGYDVQRTESGCAIGGANLDCRIDVRQMDLKSLDGQVFAGRHLVTASALLDLVSAQWLRTLADHCRSAAACALFAITYNGRSSCFPVEAEDDMVRDLMNRHQKRDKGLGGPAEGPDAVDRAEQIFSEAGFRVRRDVSDWTLGPNERELQRQLIDGWAQAAAEVAPDLASMIAEWRARRLQHVDAGRSRVVVCHDDLAATLPR